VTGPPLCVLSPMKTNEKSLLFDCYDSSDEKPSLARLCVRFLTKDEMDAFKKAWEKSVEDNIKASKNPQGFSGLIKGTGEAKEEAGAEKKEEKKEEEPAKKE
jgi:RanBP1 domain